MARYIAMRSIYGAPAGSCPQKFPAGITIADTQENAQSSPGNHALGFGWTDVVWPALTNAPNNILSPLDAAASAAMGGAPILTAGELSAVSSAYGVGV